MDAAYNPTAATTFFSPATTAFQPPL